MPFKLVEDGSLGIVARRRRAGRELLGVEKLVGDALDVGDRDAAERAAIAERRLVDDAARIALGVEVRDVVGDHPQRRAVGLERAERRRCDAIQTHAIDPANCFAAEDGIARPMPWVSRAFRRHCAGVAAGNVTLAGRVCRSRQFVPPQRRPRGGRFRHKKRKRARKRSGPGLATTPCGIARIGL
ncbi:MAG: hypothetical protein WDM81_02795 [Rhizomicrobium sp.]